jgi:hypothetical protein
MPFIPPDDVKSPREKVSNVRVIYSGNENELAIATLTYSGEESVGIRWNGNDDGPLGYPTSRNQPVWFVLPGEGGLDNIVKWIGEELKANRPISLPLTVETALEFLTNKGYSVTLSKK